MLEKSALDPGWRFSSWLHGRLNVDHAMSESVRFRVELRTQVFYADHLTRWYGYSEGFRPGDESIDLHMLWWKRKSSLAYTNVERLVLTSQRRHTTLQLGRQRINWGMAMTWNPNDIFQAGNPFDPDYVERPGVDAIRIQRSTGSLSGFEVAMVRTGPGRTRGAWRYYSNRGGYDWQVVVGWYDRQPTIGAGFAGKLGNWSFRGEAEQYVRTIETPAQLQVVLEWDRLLPHSNYLRLSGLYNRLGTIGETVNPLLLLPQTKQLMPGRWNAHVSWSREHSLRFRYGAALFYTTSYHTLILIPQFQWTLSNDWNAKLFMYNSNSLVNDHQSIRMVVCTGVDFANKDRRKAYSRNVCSSHIR